LLIMKWIVVLFSLSLLFFACKQKNAGGQEEYIFSPKEEEQADPNEPFYPFIDYIQTQIAYIDTTPFALEKIMYINGKMIDSGFVTKAAFKQLAQTFIDIDPNHSSIKPKYKETSIQDLTLNRIAFSITASNDSMPLQQADVLVNPDNEKVKTVVLRRRLEAGDSIVFQHLVWVDNRYLQISETINPGNKEEYVRVTKLIWDRDLE
jgi:hypothetical protein